jgi:hypothetical protein
VIAGRMLFRLGMGLLLAWAACGAAEAVTDRKHEVHFAGTPYELHVYRVIGREPDGPTLMIIGGIQGDEPGGFLAADRYADLTLRKGNLILVPRANFYSILKNHRGPEGDMNRRFRHGTPKNTLDRVVEIIKDLMAEADLLLNLHDGSGFYSARWEGPDRNPMRYGQSIIADTAKYVDASRGKTVELEDLARRVIGRVNPQIRNERHHFLFNNHRTFDKNSAHSEQRNSATYYALTTYGIPAFGVETSKNLPDYRVRVQYQTMVINGFMEEVGVVSDQPPMTFDPPQLQYLLVSVNRGMPLAVPDREALQVAPGDAVQIQGVVANYQRGITVDVEGMGSENDLQKSFNIQKDVRVVARKESEIFGEIRIHANRMARSSEEFVGRPSTSHRLNYFIVEVNGEKKLVENHGNLRVIQGDHVRILDVLTEGVAPAELTVNFIGFVRDEKDNPGEDRSAPIHTAKDLWPRYALDETGTRYRVVALHGNALVGEMTVELQFPRLMYLVVGQPGLPNRAYEEGVRLLISPGEEIRILDVRTNVPDNEGVSLHVENDSAMLERRDDGWTLKLNGNSTPGGEIVVTRDGIPMGRIRFQPL